VRDAADVQGHRVWQEGLTEIWIKALADGSKAVQGIMDDNSPRDAFPNLLSNKLDLT
jgi:hypothetical protein